MMEKRFHGHAVYEPCTLVPHCPLETPLKKPVQLQSHSTPQPPSGGIHRVLKFALSLFRNFVDPIEFFKLDETNLCKSHYKKKHKKGGHSCFAPFFSAFDN